MTEHRKIPLPGETLSGEKDSSLLERASGTFGLGAFSAAPVPDSLGDAPMKRAKVRKNVERVSARQAGPEQTPANPAPQNWDLDEPEPVAPTARPASETERPQPATRRETFNPPLPQAARKIAAPISTASRFTGEHHSIDRQHLREQGMIVPEGGVSALLEEFRIVKRQLIKTAREHGTPEARRILVCSPHPGEGKTFCASNLAIVLAAERDSEVLLVDADFAKPSILSTFGLPKSPGLMDVLANPALSPEEVVLGTDIPGLWVLPAGNMTHADSEYLSSQRTAQVLDQLTVGAPNRMIIFDCSPALVASHAAELAKHVGQIMLVARADITGQSALEDACRLLSACPDIKLLLNAAHFSPSGRRFGDYGYSE